MALPSQSKLRVRSAGAVGAVSIMMLAAGWVAPAAAVTQEDTDVPGQNQPIPVRPGTQLAPDPGAAQFDADNPSSGLVLVPQDEPGGEITSQSTTESGEVTTTVRPRLSPNTGERVGVAQLVTLRFPISITRKAEVAKAIKVTGHKYGKKGEEVALPKGKWGWVGSSTAVYRPKKFWPGHTKLRFSVDLKGVTVAKTENETVVGSGSATFIYELKTRRSFVLKVSNKNKRISAYRNGRLVKSFGVSLGKKGYETRSGIKVMTGIKYRVIRMRGTDRLTGKSWDVVSAWSVPLTTNGEFFHAAPWARHRIGSANGSHGCTNMNPKDAKWIFKRVKEGDPAVFKGTRRSMTKSLSYPGSKHWTHSWREFKQLAA